MRLGPIEIRWHGWRFLRRRVTLAEDVRRLCATDHRIQAIKLYRERTGLPLKQAVAEVNRLAPPGTVYL